MFRVLGHPTAACDGITRRELLRAGSLAAFLSGTARILPTNARAAGTPGVPGKNAPAKAVILIDLFGGPSHIDTFDLKPDAPPEIRGEFGSINTVLPGVRICEHLPQLAQRLDKLAVVRSVTHKYNSHNPYGVMTGFDGGHDQTDYFARPTNHPSVPSICQYFGVGHGRELHSGYVMLPAFPGYSQGLRAELRPPTAVTSARNSTPCSAPPMPIPARALRRTTTSTTRTCHSTGRTAPCRRVAAS